MNAKRKETFIVVIATIFFLSTAVLWANSRGVLGAARNDDWVYIHMAQWLSDTGEFIVESGSLTNASGLVFITQPMIWLFGKDILVFQLTVIFFSFVSVIMTWYFARLFVGIFPTVIIVLATVTSPLWLSLSISYMTDIPAYAAQIASLYLAFKGFASPRNQFAYISISLVLALFAFSIREYALIAGLTVVFSGVIFWRHRPRKLLIFLSMAFVWLVFAFLLYEWRSNLSNSVISPLALSRSDVAGAIVQMTQLAVVIGLLIIPSLALVAWRKLLLRLSKKKLILGLTFTLVLFVFGLIVYFRIGLNVGNYVTLFGSYPGTLPLGTYPEILPLWVFDSLLILGLFSSTIVLGVVIASSKVSWYWPSQGDFQPILILITFLVGSLGLLGVVVLVTTAPMIDRYALSIAPMFMILIARIALEYQSKARNVLYPVFLLFISGTLGFMYVDSSMTIDGAKWKMGTELTRQGFDSQTIDAGYEWFGYHQTEIAQGRFVQQIPNWWTTLYENPNVCVLVGVGLPSELEKEQSIFETRATSLFGIQYNLWAIPYQERCSKDDSEVQLQSLNGSY